MEFIEAFVTKRIQCPIDTVKAQFFDFDHHIRAKVHHGARFSILSKSNDKTHLLVEAKLAGMTQKDEWIVYRTPSGGLMHEFVSGMNKGGGIEIRFTAEGNSTTLVEGRAFLPKRGIKKFLAPIFRMALVKISEKSLEEDRIDLESGNYRAS